METTINQRLKILIDELGLTPNSFATKLDLNPNVIYNSLKEKSKPGFDVLNKIVETFDVNPDWLLKNVTSDDTTILRHDLRHNVRHKPQKNTLNRDFLSSPNIEDIERSSSKQRFKVTDEYLLKFFQILNNDPELKEYNDLYLELDDNMSDLIAFFEKHTNELYTKALEFIELQQSKKGKIDKEKVNKVIEILSPLKQLIEPLRQLCTSVEDGIMAVMPYDEYDIIWPKDVPKPPHNQKANQAQNQVK